jgi:hypothetical protein
MTGTYLRNAIANVDNYLRSGSDSDAVDVGGEDD